MYSLFGINEIPQLPFKSEEIKTIGRYKKLFNGNEYICDVVFNKITSDDDINKNYLNNNIGYHQQWTYDLDCIEMKNIVMEWIDMLPKDKRTIRNVIRHIMHCMSYDNIGDKALFNGDLSNGYKNNNEPPTKWENSSQVFKARYNNNKAIKCDQHWCFTECMTSILRFLGIACKTIYGKNTLLDDKINNGIDLINESDDKNLWSLVDNDNINKSIKNLTNGITNKGESWNIKKIFRCGDSYWNIRYWNEIYIPSGNTWGWEVIDSTPIIKSISDDKYNSSKIAGPCKLSAFKNDSILNNTENYDFKRLFLSVNSPYRLWKIETIIKNNISIDIPYVYSVIYPLSKKLSCYIKNSHINNLFENKPLISSKVYDENNHISIKNVTSNYIGTNNLNRNIYYESINKMDKNLYIQTVYLDKFGIVIGYNKYTGTLDDMILNKDKNVSKYKNCYIISYLIIENFNGDFNLSLDTSLYIQNENKTKWIAFCEYNKFLT